MIYDFATAVSYLCSKQDRYELSKLTWQVTATQKQLSAFPDAINFLL